jgi:hypothetical protein
VPRDLATAADAITRIGVSIAAGQAPIRIGWAILAFFVIHVACSLARYVVTPVFKALGKRLAAKVEARLLPPERSEEDH